MSEPTITPDDLSEAVFKIRRENLQTMTIICAMQRLHQYSGEMDGDDLAALALETEALLEVVHDRLAEFAGELLALGRAEA